MKFTLVTSFYKGSKYILDLYSKIQSQTYTNWEWVVTDDFSDNDSKEILINLSKQDRKVKYVEQSFKKEMFYNPQNFCKNAEIIVQVDQDDWPLPKALEVYHHFFTKFPDTIMITCSGNMFYEDGGWMNFYNPDYTEIKNMTCGYLTQLRAWRNNPHINYDFNPGGWMKYYYNDLSIICTLEEQGKILNLPRVLYYYNYRADSISHTFYPLEAEKEGEDLIASINAKRPNKDIDTLNRYFESIHKETLCFVDHNLNNINTQIKISYLDKELNFKKDRLLKELFFDHELNINKLDGDEEYVVLVVRTVDDLEEYFTYPFKENQNIQIVIWHQRENPYTNDILERISSRYPLHYYHSAFHNLINIMK